MLLNWNGIELGDVYEYPAIFYGYETPVDNMTVIADCCSCCVAMFFDVEMPLNDSV